MTFTTQNPALFEDLETYSYHSLQDADVMLVKLMNSQKLWSKSTLDQRKLTLQKLASLLLKNRDDLAKMMALEMGKPYLQGLAEVDKSAACTQYYVENMEHILSTEKVQLSGQYGLVLKQSLGIIFAIMPWNFPLWQLARFAIPAIAAGNVILMKHSDLTAGTACLIEKIFLQISEQPLLLNAQVTHEDSAKIISDGRIRGVTFTGSTRGGRQVAQVAGQSLKKTVLELGGSDAYFILQDADVKLAAQSCARSRMVNGGQSCVAAKRFFVQESVYEEFLAEFSKQLMLFPSGNPLSKEIIRGPLAHQKFQKQIHSQVHEMIKTKKAKLLMGGELPTEKGAYYPATILQMSEDSALWTEEYFGPVACVWKFREMNLALQQANHSVYGLGAAIFSKDVARAMLYAEQIESGMVAINEMIQSDPHMPFGGVKDSGYGRELSSYGLHEFLNIKSVTIKT